MMKAVQSLLGSNCNFGQASWEQAKAELCGILGATEELGQVLGLPNLSKQ